MPVTRVTYRRRSSLATGLPLIRPGQYGITPSSPNNVTFAPNITPGTYIETDGPVEDIPPEDPLSPSLFPPSETPAPAPSRRRAPPGKRRSQGYIPRPPNAFMLFRADFVRQKHVPGSIETNHGSLSKIIGNCWRALPFDQKRVWENLAKKAKQEHRQMYPDYRFKPVHKKDKKKGKAASTSKRIEKMSPLPISADERRCEDVAQLLLEGKKGEELAEAIRQLEYDRSRSETNTPDIFGEPWPSSSQIHMPTPIYAHRRSSSVPPSIPIIIPQLPFLSSAPGAGGSRVPSPVGNISRSQRTYLGQRRASSAQPMPSRNSRSWMYPMNFAPHTSLEPWQLQRDFEPLPEPDTSLFESTYVNGNENPFGFASSNSSRDGSQGLFSYPDYSQQAQNIRDLSLSISPLERYPSDSSLSSASSGPFSAISSSASPFSTSTYLSQQDPMSLSGDMNQPWMESGPSSAFSGSPEPSEHALSAPASQALDTALYAPQPQQAPSYEHWIGSDSQPQHMHMAGGHAFPASGLGLQTCGPEMAADVDMGMHMTMQAADVHFAPYEQQPQEMFSGQYEAYAYEAAGAPVPSY